MSSLIGIIVGCTLIIALTALFLYARHIKNLSR